MRRFNVESAAFDKKPLSLADDSRAATAGGALGGNGAGRLIVDDVGVSLRPVAPA